MSNAHPIFAQVTSRRSLNYTAVHPDYGPHVRAGSGLAWVGDELAIVKDDSLCVAWFSPTSGALRVTALPTFDGAHLFDDGLGNKKSKPDFEAAISWINRGQSELIALGSGSSEQRYKIARVQQSGQQVEMIDASRWYGDLKANHAFAGSRLNIEGAVCDGEKVYLFQRGNGAASDGRLPVNAMASFAIAEVQQFLDAPKTAAVPAMRALQRFDLGGFHHNGALIAWGFADACFHSGKIWFVLSAEASPDVLDDGEVAAAAIGFLDDSGAHFGLISDTNGQVVRDKLEGLASDGSGGFYAVSDNDDPAQAAQLLGLVLIR